MRVYLKALAAVIGLVVAVLGLVTAWIQLNKETVSPTPVILVVTATSPSPLTQAPDSSAVTPGQVEIPTNETPFTSEGISWLHNPNLPAPQGFPGAITYTKRDFPGNSNSDWVYGVEVSLNSEQMLIVAGYAGNLAGIGEMGGATHCFLLMTRGPFNGKIDVLSAGVEIHEVASAAITLNWAAQKANDLQATYPACAQGIDLWIGR